MPVHSLIILFAAALIAWIHHYGAPKRESWRAVLLAAAAGFVAMWGAGRVDDFALGWSRLAEGHFIFKAAAIALIEEGAKLLTVLALAHVLIRRHFDDPMDGLIFGCIAGVGMAVQESFLYLSFSTPTLQAIGMEIVRLFAHSLMAGIIGFAVGVGISPDGKSKHHPRLILLCLALSTTMHFGWDVVAYTRHGDLLSHILPMWLMLIMMIVWRYFCSLARSRSSEFFTSPGTIA